MKRRMLNFYCEDCKFTFEDLAFIEDDGSFEKPKCPKCKKECQVVEDLRSRLHRDGNHYSHVSWSLHNVAE